jgi:hypothetical protein
MWGAKVKGRKENCVIGWEKKETATGRKLDRRQVFLWHIQEVVSSDWYQERLQPMPISEATLAVTLSGECWKFQQYSRSISNLVTYLYSLYKAIHVKKNSAKRSIIKLFKYFEYRDFKQANIRTETLSKLLHTVIPTARNYRFFRVARSLSFNLQQDITSDRPSDKTSKDNICDGIDTM